MTRAHEALVASRFDALEGRFRAGVGPDDFRLLAVRRALGTLAGLRVLDLGCGKGRFAAHWREAGAEVVGLDVSAAMLRGSACAFERVRGSALRLPFAGGAFDAAVAIEVVQHWPPGGLERGLEEARRVLRPGGRLVIVDRNAAALDARRPWLPALAVKRLDEWRGLWMYRPGEAARERWPWPGALRRRIARNFVDVEMVYLNSPRESDNPRWRRFRSMVLWSARVPGGPG